MWKNVILYAKSVCRVAKGMEIQFIFVAQLMKPIGELFLKLKKKKINQNTNIFYKTTRYQPISCPISITTKYADLDLFFVFFLYVHFFPSMKMY